MNPKAALLLVMLMAWSNSASSGILDDTDDLKGKVVVAAGNVEELRCPPYGKHDCGSWPRSLLRFRKDNVCIVSEILACGISCTGFLAMGRDEIPYFFALKQFGNGMKKYSAKVAQCPSMY